MAIQPRHVELSSLPDSVFEGHDTRIGRDLKQNLTRLLEHSSLTPEEAGLAFLALATSVGMDALAHYAREKLAALGVPLEQMQEAAESAAMMKMVNVYYSFRGVVGNDMEYGLPRLQMSVLMAPKIGQPRFDMLAFALSIINHCAPCILGHEKSLREAGIGIDKIHDLARLAAVMHGLAVLSAA